MKKQPLLKITKTTEDAKPWNINMTTRYLSTKITGKDDKTVVLNEVFSGGTTDSDDEI